MPKRSGPDPDDFAKLLEEAPEDARTVSAREELQRWQAFAAAPWAKPETIAEAIRKARERRTIWLLEAIDMMAFGASGPSKGVVEVAARRLQACRALCAAAAEGAITLVGMLGESSERVETIAPACFDAEYRIGQGSNVLELDASAVSPQDDAKFDRLHLARWFDVRIGEKARFLAWLSARVASPASSSKPAQTSKSRKGQGAYAAIDQPLLDEMEQLITTRKVASVQAAAALVAKRAHGNSTEESKTTRLAISYRKRDRRSPR